MRQILSIADDLSGAIEAAVELGAERSRIWLLSSHDASIPLPDLDDAVVVLDSNSRQLEPNQAELLYLHLLKSLKEKGSYADTLIYLKIDSLVRGNVQPIISAAKTLGPVMFIPALPRLGRHTKNGAITVGGVALKETKYWKLEKVEPPESLVDFLKPVPSEVIRLQDPRAEKRDLIKALESTFARGAVAVCDAESEKDLENLIAAAVTFPNLIIVGSSGVASFLGVYLGRETVAAPVLIEVTGNRKIVAFVGSGSEKSQEQLKSAETAGFPTYYVVPEEFPLQDIPLLHLLESQGVALLGIKQDSANQAQHRELIELINEQIKDVTARASLILTGGETARIVLESLSTQWLRPLKSHEYGVVIAVTDLGQLVAVKPGTFGSPNTLVGLIEELQKIHTESSAH